MGSTKAEADQQHPDHGHRSSTNPMNMHDDDPIASCPCPCGCADKPCIMVGCGITWHCHCERDGCPCNDFGMTDYFIAGDLALIKEIEKCQE